MSEDPTPYGRHDPVVALRLELGRERDRAEAFRLAFNVEVLKVMRVAVIQATIDADNEIARLKDENAQLKAEVERLTNCKSEADRLKAEVERLRKAGDYMADHLAHEFGTCPSIEVWNAAKEGNQP